MGSSAATSPTSSSSGNWSSSFGTRGMYNDHVEAAWRLTLATGAPSSELVV